MSPKFLRRKFAIRASGQLLNSSRKQSFLSWISLAVALFILPAGMFGQANINESLETSFIYVNGTTGSDSNPGTQQSPLKTIGAAATMATTLNHENLGVRVIIAPGTYRESVNITAHSADTAKPTTYQAATNGTVFISGAVQYTGWQPASSNPSIYTNAWPNSWGLCPLPTENGRWKQPGPLQQDIVRRREMVFVNGNPLTQVLSASQMQPATFSVNESTHVIYIWPPAGTDVNTADVEVATLPELFSILGKSNVVLRGLTFEYSNSCRNNSAVSIAGGANNILVDSDNFLWNNAGGFYIGNAGTANFTVQSAIANHNGQWGFGSAETKNGLWKSGVTSYNNWRGAQGAYYVWNSGGSHFYSPHTDTVNGLVVAYNQTHGIHWDTDIQNISATGVVSVQNLVDGIFFEVVQGPATVANSYVCSNDLGVHDQYLQGGGFELRNSEQISFINSTLYNNGASQFNIQGVQGGIPITNWETGQYYNLVTQNFTNKGNSIQGVGSSEQLFFDSYLGGSDWSSFANTLNSSGNAWWNSSNSSVFTLPSPKPHTISVFSGWKSSTGQDASSNWVSPEQSKMSGCNVAVDAPDYWMIVDSASHTISSNTATFTVSLTPVGSFSGNASLSFDGVSEVKGLSAKLSSTTSAVPGSASLVVTAASGTASGTYPITIIANSGKITRTVTASLVVP